MNSSITHDNVCELIHKKRHPKIYHGDIKYNMALNKIFNVVTPIFSNLGPLTNLFLHVTKDGVLDRDALETNTCRLKSPLVGAWKSSGLCPQYSTF